MLTTESKQLWRAVRFAILITTIGGTVSFAVTKNFQRLSSESGQYMTVNLVHSSMAILSIFLAVFVVSVIKESPTSHKCEVSIQDLYVWLITALALSSSVLFIEGLTPVTTLLLGCSIALFIAITTAYFALLVSLVSKDFFRIAAVGLLLPNLLSSFRILSSTSTPLVEVLSQAAIHGIALVVILIFFIGRVQILSIRKEEDYQFLPVVTASIAIALLLGSVNIPLQLPEDEKIHYLNVIQSTRLPLFAVATFLILSSKWQLLLASEPIRSLVTRRRLGMLGSIVGSTAFVLFLCGLPLSLAPKNSLSLSLSVGLVSTLTAILLPWISIRIRDLRIDHIDVLVLLTASSLTFWFRDSTVLWQRTSLITLTLILIIFSIRHYRRTGPLLRSVQIERSKESHHQRDGLTSVVIPSFNPGQEIVQTLSRVRLAFQLADLPCEIIVVSDGSTDESIDLLENSTDVDLHVWLRTNHGKGGALREGFARANGEVICFIDADGDLDPIALPAMSRLVWANEFDIVYGSKAHPDSDVTMSTLRKFVSSVFRSIVRILFRFDVSDTQTGIKAFNGRFIRTSLQLTSEEGFNLDLELFVVAQTLGYNRFGEYSVALARRGNSSVGLGTVVAMFVSTLRMYLRFNFTLDYVRAPGINKSYE